MSKILRRGLVDRDGTLAARVPVEKRLKSRQWREEMLPGRGKVHVLNTNQVSTKCTSTWASADERSCTMRELRSW